MNKSWFYLVGAIGSLAILTTGCGDGSKPAATPSPSPVTASPTTPAPTAAVPTTTPPTSTPIATVPAVGTTPVVPGKPGAVAVASAGLIPPTNGDNWAKTVTKGRSDPFATLVLQPVATKDPLAATGKPQPVVPIANDKSSAVKSGVNKSLPKIKTIGNSTNIADVSGKQKIARKGKNSTDSGITRDRDSRVSAIPTSGANKVLPKNTKPSKSKVITKVATNPGKNKNVLRPVTMPPPNKIAAIPAKVAEKPLQAMALEISGIIEVDGKTQVIVKLPSESFSRYIDVGERVANGSVLVKRIEGQNSIAPTVVLEEVGVEVSRRIGDKPPASTPSPATPPARP
jgi:hypothetical protein